MRKNFVLNYLVKLGVLYDRIKNLPLFIRWSFLEKINPFKEKKLFIVGLSKTGTTSLHDALRLLGIKSIHYPQFYYLDASKNNLKFKWHWKFERSRAFADIPVVAFLDELIRRYPNAYVIYTSRDKGKWLESCRKHFQELAINPVGEALRLKVYGVSKFDFNLFSERYDKHSKMILERFKDHPNFIEIKLEQKDKWGPLCTFLDIPTPKEDYPHSNMYAGSLEN